MFADQKIFKSLLEIYTINIFNNLKTKPNKYFFKIRSTPPPSLLLYEKYKQAHPYLILLFQKSSPYATLIENIGYKLLDFAKILILKYELVLYQKIKSSVEAKIIHYIPLKIIILIFLEYTTATTLKN